MGATFANDLSELAGEGSLTLERAISLHFSANTYPPIPQSAVPVAVKAVERANKLVELELEGIHVDWEEPVKLPEGVTWRGHIEAPLTAVITGWHLESFIDYGGEYSDGE